MANLIYVQLPAGYEKRLAIEDVADLVCEHLQVPIHAIKGKSRWRTATDARHIIAWLCCRYTKATLTQIGKYLGGRDHTTILHGRDKINDLLDTHDPLSADVHALQRQIEQLYKTKNAA